MAKGIREVFIQSLKDAGFTEDEDEALASTWNRNIRPIVVGFFDDIALAIREEHTQNRAPLTNEATRTQFRVARELFVVDRLVYLYCTTDFFSHINTEHVYNSSNMYNCCHVLPANFPM